MSAPLAGVVVLDLSRALAGPHAAMMLGDLGARVIKVESPDGGDDARGWGPPFAQPDDPCAARESTYFLSCNRNKESIVLDLKSDSGRSNLSQLIGRSDVLVENFRPGVLDRLGFPVDRLQELNPALVVLSISGFGHDGPESGRGGYDQILQGEAGLMSLTGSSPKNPTRVGVPIGDLLAGMYGAYGVVAALHERNRTHRGGVVRTSLLAAIVGVHAFQGTRWTVAHEVPRALGNHHPSIAPYGAFRASDGFLQLSVGSDALWRKFAPLVGISASDPRFYCNSDRVEHRDELINVIEDAFAGETVEHWTGVLDVAGIPAGQIRTLDKVYEWEQTKSQGLLIDVQHSTLGPIQLPGPPLRFDGVAQVQHRPPPVLGQHTDEVLAWLEMSDIPSVARQSID
jgi:crotonobetainyl-CoA:carnitine CoA-transferase CaiB-like acyl-CoA transferase